MPTEKTAIMYKKERKKERKNFFNLFTSIRKIDFLKLKVVMRAHRYLPLVDLSLFRKFRKKKLMHLRYNIIYEIM